MAKLYAIGVGPGDPELMTLKAHRILQEVETIFVPKSRKENSSVAYEIARQFIPEETKIEYLYMPMISEREQLMYYWDIAAQQVTESLQSGDAAFLTIGDSLTYSTATYLAQSLGKIKSDAEVSFIPGITSYNAGAAQIGIPLVEGDEPLLILPTAATAQHLRLTFSSYSSCVLLKVSRYYDAVLDVLQELNLTKKAVLICRCGTEQERIITDLESLRGQKIDYLSLMIVKGGGS